MAGAAWLASGDFRTLEAVVPGRSSGGGGDFWIFLTAARRIADNHSLYNVAQATSASGYVYSPLIALLLLPFSHSNSETIWHAWTALSLIAMVASGALITLNRWRELHAWRGPLLFGFTAFTGLHFLLAKVDLQEGQVDTFVLFLLVAAAVASEREWAAFSGFLIGLCGLLKTWPAAVGVVAFRRGYRHRWRTIVAIVATMALGPILASTIGGASGVIDYLKTTFDSRSQHLISHSVWGTPALLFSRSGLARPILVSTGAQVLATIVLAGWVLGLLVFTLLRGQRSALTFLHVLACVVLIVPVSHSDYSLYLLPILWIWAGRFLENPRFRSEQSLAVGLLVVWWLVLFKIDWSPSAVGSPTSSALRIAVIFFVNLAALTASIVVDHRQSTRVLQEESQLQVDVSDERRSALDPLPG